jgi:hypothetical protein
VAGGWPWRRLWQWLRLGGWMCRMQGVLLHFDNGDVMNNFWLYI